MKLRKKVAPSLYYFLYKDYMILLDVSQMDYRWIIP